MSLVALDSEMVIASVVEAMLPRFSDNELGLLISVRMDMHDFGYGSDGNTFERDELCVSQVINLLFVRPGNYTQVYSNVTEFNKWNSLYNNDKIKWIFESDHDSCWRSDGLRILTDSYFKMADKFKGRIKSGKEMSGFDTHHFFCFDGEPKYVRRVKCEQVNPKSDRYSKEGREFSINLKSLQHEHIEVVPYGGNDMSGKYIKWSGGLYVKGSDAHTRHVAHAEKNPPPPENND